MRGRLALPLALSLAFHGALFAWSTTWKPARRQSVIEIEYVEAQRAAKREGGEKLGGGADAAPEGGGPEPGREIPQRTEPLAARAEAPSSPPAQATRAEGGADSAPPPEELAGAELTAPLDDLTEAELAPTRKALAEGEPAPSLEEASTEEALAHERRPGAEHASVGGEGGGREDLGSAPGNGTGDGPGGGSGGGEAGVQGDPHAVLLSHLRAHAKRCYPPLARRRSIQGTVGLAFCIDEDGNPHRMRLEKSSGSTLLDDAARECVIEGAAPLPGPVGCVSLDLPFRLR